MEEREDKKKKLPIWAKMIIAVGALAALFLAVFLLRDVPPFNSYRIFMKRTVNSAVNDKERTEMSDGRVVESEDFAEINKEVPFKVTRPIWMPEGFVLDYADYNKMDEDYSIVYRYISEENEGEFVEFNIRDYPPIDPQNYSDDFKEISINGINIYMLDLDEDGCYAEYMNNQGLVVGISGTMNQETLTKIIENMD